MSTRQISESQQSVQTGLQLVPVRSTFDLEPIELMTGRFRVGSASDCDVQIDVEGIAEQHCMLVVGRRRTIIQAWSPMTWINDGAVKEGTLRDGDRLILGPVEFEVQTAAIVQPAPHTVSELTTALQHSQAMVTTPAGPTQAETARQEHVDGMLADVQSMLDEFFEQKRNTEAEFSSQREKLLRFESELQEQHQEVKQRLQALHRQKEELQQSKIAAQSQVSHSAEAELAARKLSLEQQQTELDAREVTLTEQRAALEREHSALLESQEELKREQTALNEWKTGLQQREEAVQATEARALSLDAVETELKQRSESLNALEAELQAQRKLLKQRSADVEDQFERLAGEKQELATTREELAQQEASFQQRDEELVARSNELVHRGAELDERAATIQKQAQELGNRATELDIREEAVQQQLAQLQADQSALEKKTQELTARRAEAESTANTRDTELQDREQSLHALTQQLQERERSLQEREESLAKKETQFTEQQSTQADRETELNFQREELERREHAFAAEQSETDAAAAEIEQLKAELEQALSTADATAAEASQELQASLTAQEEELSQRTETLTAQAAELEARQQELEQRDEQLTAERERLESLQTELSERETTITATEAAQAELAEQRDREAEIEQHEVLNLREQQLAQREQELEERAQQLFEQENELAATQQSMLSVVSTESDASESDDTILVNEALNEQLEGVLQERDELAALRAELEQERDELLAEIRELRSERESFKATSKEYHDKLAEVEEERDAFVQERQSLIAERQGLEDRIKEQEAQTEDWNEKSKWLQEERQALTAERDALEMERDLLMAERTVLQEQAVQLKTLQDSLPHADVVGDSPTDVQDIVEEAHSSPLALTDNLLTENFVDSIEVEESQELDTEEGDKPFIESGMTVEEESSTVMPADSPLSTDEESDLLNRNDLLDAAEQDMAFEHQIEADEAADSTVDLISKDKGWDSTDSNEFSATTAQDVDAPAASTQDDDPANALRSELAELFGFSSGSPASQLPQVDFSRSEQSTTERSERDEIEPPFSEIDAEEKLPFVEADEPPEPSSAASPFKTNAKSDDDDSVASYMEQLLARTRRSAPQVPPSPPPQKIEEPVEVPEPDGISMLNDLFPSVGEEEPEKKSEKNRKLNQEDKQAMRANLDSFREVANQSARNAVAKSQAGRARSSFKVFTAAAAMAWGVSVVFLTAEFWMGASQRTFGVISAIVALLLTLKAGLLFLDVQRNQVTAIATFEDDVEDDVDHKITDM